MKGRKLLALAVAVILALALAVPALGAEATNHADFDDLMVLNPYTEDESYLWEWAWPTVDDAIRRGLFIGYTPYTDANGKEIVNFGPADAVTETVGLTLCARMMVDKAQRETILADRLEQMRQIIPGTAKDPDDPNAPYVWFRREAATCLELGIVAESDLVRLRDTNRLGAPMTKADFAKYLVRAMGLEDFAKGLNTADLPFEDEAKIDREYRPFVKLLSTYGVLTGDHLGNFNPNDSMNRAVCATMLSRAIENIQEEREVTVDLPRYTTYSWTEGYIQSVALQDDGSRVMVIKSDITGTHTVTLPANVSIYQHNMKAGTTELKNGTFAKVCFNGDGKAAMVRLTPAGFLSSIEGDCDAVTDETVTVDGVVYTIDRFTEVAAGGKTGDRDIIDPEAAYTGARLVTNSRKSVLSLELTGGTRQVEGILADVTTANLGATTQTTLTVNNYSGLPTTYKVEPDLGVTVDGRQVDEVQKSYVGRHVTLRVDAEDLGQLKSVDVDSKDHYVQGILGLVNLKMDPVRVEITATGGAKPTPYEVDEACEITYEGKATALKDIPLNTFVTARVEGGTLTWLSAWTGIESTKGTLTGLTYADPIVLTVTKEDNTVSEFTVPMDRLSKVTILVNGEDADITKLSTGDEVTVTLHYHDVTQIDVTPRAADVSGILDAFTRNADGSAVLRVRFNDGSTKEYTAATSATVTRSDKPVALTELVNATGLTVSLVTDGNRAVSISFSGTSVSQDSVEGVVIAKADQDRTITVLPSGADAKPVKIHVGTGVTVTAVDGTDLHNISRINVNDPVIAYGSYNATGTFEATLLIRK